MQLPVTRFFFHRPVQAGHLIVSVGNDPLCENIVDDPKAFVRVVRENGYYISNILWWERAQIIAGSQIGYGGPRDPKCPDTHFFSETYIQKKFDTVLRDEEYFEYFDSIKTEFPELELFAGFDIKPIPQDQA